MKSPRKGLITALVYPLVSAKYLRNNNVSLTSSTISNRSNDGTSFESGWESDHETGSTTSSLLTLLVADGASLTVLPVCVRLRCSNPRASHIIFAFALRCCCRWCASCLPRPFLPSARRCCIRSLFFPRSDCRFFSFSTTVAVTGILNFLYTVSRQEYSGPLTARIAV